MNVEYGEQTFDDTAMYGDNTNRLDDIMSVPTIGNTSIVRYKVPTEKNACVQCMALGCDFGARLLQGAYASAQDGAQVQVRFGGVIKFEQKFNWTGLSGYIGGADDYNAENEIMFTCYDQAINAGTVIDFYITGKTNIRRMITGELYGVLDDGTVVRQGIKQAVDGTAATSVPVYTVPAGRILYLKQLVVTTRHIDIYAGKGYLVYNGLPVMSIDIAQTELGGVYGLVFPFYDLPLKESASIGFRLDSFACGNEIVTGTVYSDEHPLVDPAAVAAAVWVRAGRELTS